MENVSSRFAWAPVKDNVAVVIDTTTGENVLRFKGRDSWKRAEGRARSANIKEEVRAIVATEKCPKCGRGLRRNLALAGWWQCEQFGAVGFRKDASQPACDWQGFTE